LWRRGSATLREVNLYEGSRLAHSTVMTTIDRLFKKGVLSRVQLLPSKAYLYTPVYTQAKLEIKAATASLRNTFALDTLLPLSHLVDVIAEL
jgi:BlaI family penicillinase repressor